MLEDQPLAVRTLGFGGNESRFTLEMAALSAAISTGFSTAWPSARPAVFARPW